MLLPILQSFLKHQQTTYILTLLLFPGYGNYFLAESWTVTSSPKKFQAYFHASVCPLWSFAFRSLHISVVSGVESSSTLSFTWGSGLKQGELKPQALVHRPSWLEKILHLLLKSSHGSPIAKLFLSLLFCLYSLLPEFNFYLYTRLNIMN